MRMGGRNYILLTGAISILCLMFGGWYQKRFLTDKPSLEIVAHPKEMIIDNDKAIQGLKVFFGHAEINQLVKYAFTLRNNGDATFNEGTFGRNPVRIKFASPIMGTRTDEIFPSSLACQVYVDEQGGSVIIQPESIFNPGSSVVFSVFTAEMHDEPYIVEDINIPGVTKITVRQHDVAQITIKNRIKNDMKALFFSLYFIYFAFFGFLATGIYSQKKLIESELEGEIKDNEWKVETLQQDGGDDELPGDFFAKLANEAFAGNIKNLKSLKDKLSKEYRINRFLLGYAIIAQMLIVIFVITIAVIKQ